MTFHGASSVQAFKATLEDRFALFFFLCIVCSLYAIALVFLTFTGSFIATAVLLLSRVFRQPLPKKEDFNELKPFPGGAMRRQLLAMFWPTFRMALRVGFTTAASLCVIQFVIMVWVLWLGQGDPGRAAKFVELRNQRPGSEWTIDPLPSTAYRAPIERVAVVTDVYLPKMDGVTKLTTYVVQHHMNAGREVLLVVPQLELYGYKAEDFIPQPTKDTPLSRRSRCRMVVVPSVSLVQEETRLPIPGLGYSVLVDFKPQLLHMFNPFQMGFTATLYARFHPDIPVIANYQTDLPGAIHSLGFDILSIPSNFMWHYTRWVHNGAILNLVATKGKAEVLVDRGFEGVRIWDRGINTTRFHPSLRSAAMRRRLLGGRPDNTLLVLYVGRLSPEKTIHLAEGITELQGVHFAVVGDGPLRESLTESFGKHATFVGMLVGQELAQAYASSDVFGFTGCNEVAANVLKEAQASGLPVLLPNSGGISSLIVEGRTGFVYEPTKEDFKRRVQWCLENRPRLRQMGQAARRLAESRSWDTVMVEMEHFYAEAVALTRRRRLQGAAARWARSARLAAAWPACVYYAAALDGALWRAALLAGVAAALVYGRRPAVVARWLNMLALTPLAQRGSLFLQRLRQRGVPRLLGLLLLGLLAARLGLAILHLALPSAVGPYERLTAAHMRAQPPAAATATAAPPALDVVMCARRPTCVNRAVIRRVQLVLSPRRIFILAPGSACPAFTALGSIVHCLPEGSVLPGVDVASIALFMERVHHRPSQWHLGRTTAGWYLQQFLKLGVLLRVPDLSDHFLVWDSDMLMTNSFQPFTPDGRVRQHVGGFFIRGYGSFHHLTGHTLLHASDWSSLVVHHAVVFKPFMVELLRALAGPAAGNLSDAGWVWRILENIPADDLQLGFSEYAAYNSWVLHHHPETVHVEASKLWTRYPPWGMMPRPWSHDCCPSAEDVQRIAGRRDVEFVGWELGHLPFCQTDLALPAEEAS